MISQPIIVKNGTLTMTQYTLLHAWVRKELGKPKLCENCGTKTARRYEWANLSSEYLHDLSDWARLCVRCHRLIDGTLGNLTLAYTPEVLARRAATKRKTHAARRLPCSVDGCETYARVKGLCVQHYKHQWYERNK